MNPIENYINLTNAQARYERIKAWLDHDRSKRIHGNIMALEWRLKQAKLSVIQAELAVYC